MRHLRNRWDRLERSFSGKKDKLLIVDLDGTLVPIMKTPDAVSLDGRARGILTVLSQTPGLRLVIVSGRRMKELYSIIRLKNTIYIGNHGLEFRGRALTLP